MTVGDTIGEPIEVHYQTQGDELKDRITMLLKRVIQPIMHQDILMNYQEVKGKE